MSRQDFRLYPFREALKYTMQDLVPTPLRFRWPFKRYFWQADEITRVHARAEELYRLFGGPVPEPCEAPPPCPTSETRGG